MSLGVSWALPGNWLGRFPGRLSTARRVLVVLVRCRLFRGGASPVVGVIHLDHLFALALVTGLALVGGSGPILALFLAFLCGFAHPSRVGAGPGPGQTRGSRPATRSRPTSTAATAAIAPRATWTPTTLAINPPPMGPAAKPNEVTLPLIP